MSKRSRLSVPLKEPSTVALASPDSSPSRKITAEGTRSPNIRSPGKSKERKAIDALSSLTWRRPSTSRPETYNQKPIVETPSSSREGSLPGASSKSKSPMDKLLSGPTTTTGDVSLGNGEELKKKKQADQPTATKAKDSTANGKTAASTKLGADAANQDDPTVNNPIKLEPTTYTSYVFSWFSSGNTDSATPERTSDTSKQSDNPPETQAKATPPQPPPDHIRPASSPTAPTTAASESSATANPPFSSWFYFWPAAESVNPAEDEVKKADENGHAAPEDKAPPSLKAASVKSKIEPPKVAPVAVPDKNELAKIAVTGAAASKGIELPRPLSSSSLPLKSAGWTFWGKPQASSTSTLPVETTTVDAATSSKPATAAETEAAKQVRDVNDKGLSKPKDPDVPTIKPSPRAADPDSTPISPKVVKTDAKTTEADTSTQKQARSSLPPNILVPSFESCYPDPHRGYSIISSITRLFGPARVPRQQLNLLPRPYRIRKAVAIGVHGFFPMKLLQRVLGEPSGTSQRFSSCGAAAIERWARKNSMKVEIEKIALEGEGKIADRVEILWKLLGKYIDTVKRADFVFVVCHSQGTPVGVQLAARLFTEGMVDKGKVGILGMAGVSLGPFAELNSRILSGSAKELFDFSDPNSIVSKNYLDAIRVCTSRGAKITFVGSIDDQLVSLQSALFSTISHPFILRACFVDGRVHAPSFVTHLVSFALKLRNLGFNDHGVIRELSAPLAGSLYSGEGHSRIYDDNCCYDLAIRQALETTTLEYLNLPLRVDPVEPLSSNPFFLPWSVRGLLEEKIVREEMSDEAASLLRQFDQWKPATKVLKDVKYRLDAIRSIDIKSKL